MPGFQPAKEWPARAVTAPDENIGGMPAIKHDVDRPAGALAIGTKTYAFFSVAHDGAGNVEPPRFTADATTRVLSSIHIYLPATTR
jgi:hypothetical protein